MSKTKINPTIRMEVDCSKRSTVLDAICMIWKFYKAMKGGAQ